MFYYQHLNGDYNEPLHFNGSLFKQQYRQGLRLCLWSFICNTHENSMIMKKIMFSIVVLFLANTMMAQRSNVLFGIKAGVNFANFNDNDVRNTSAKTGFNVGGLAHIHLADHFAIQPEIVYSTQGAQYSSVAKTHYNYINVPVLGQYMFGDGFRVQTGPQIGFLTSAKNKNNDVEIDIDNSVKSVDFDWAFGLSYITHHGIGIDGRYNLGLTDISKNNSDVKNRVWQIGLFYQFHH